MDEQPQPSPAASAGAAAAPPDPRPASPPPSAAPGERASPYWKTESARKALLAAGAAALFLAGAAAGYRLYAEQRAETAAEAVRIKAFLDARAQADVLMTTAAAPRARAEVGPKIRTSPTAAARATAKTKPERKPAAVKAKKTPPAADRPKTQTKPRAAPKPARPPRVLLAGRDARAATAGRSTAEPSVQVAQAARVESRARSVDRLYEERSSSECAPGLLGFICREVVRMQVCGQHDAWGKATACPASAPQRAWPMSGLG